MPGCSVKGCKNWNGNTKPQINISYYRFPQDNRKHAWIQFCDKEKLNLKNARICSVHFEDDDFILTGQHLMILGEQPKRRLRPTAIPTIKPILRNGKKDRSLTVINHMPSMFVEAQITFTDENSQNSISSEGKKKGDLADINDVSPASEGSRNVLTNTTIKSESNTHISERDPKERRENIEKEILHLKAELNRVNSENEELINRNSILKEENRSVKSAIGKLKSENVKLNKKMQNNETNLSKKIEEKCYCILRPIFTPGQIKLLLHPNQSRVVWKPEDISAAIALLNVTPKGYRYLKMKKYPLPSLSTLRKWAAKKITMNPGVLSDVIKMMKNKGSDQPVQNKLCILSFDELHISQNIEADEEEECPVGSPTHQTVQVGMVRALFHQWKQVVYFSYDEQLSLNNVTNVIEQLYEAGYVVVGVISDQVATSSSIWKQIDIGIDYFENCCFPHPRDPSLKVFVFADPGHLLKCIRNHLLDSGFLIDDEFIDKRWLEMLLSVNNSDAKIEQRHLDIKLSDRQNVAIAAELLSNNTAEAIRWCGENNFFSDPSGFYSNWETCADLITLCSDWFDVFNSKSESGNVILKNAYGVNQEEQDIILNNMTNVMKKMRVGNNESLLPFQKDIILSNTSLQELLEYLKTKYSCQEFSVSHILTYRLNRNVLENLFSYVRGAGHCKPSVLQFKYRLRWYVLEKHYHDMFTANSNSDDDTTDEDLVSALEKKEEIKEILGDVYDEDTNFVENEDDDQGFPMEYQKIKHTHMYPGERPNGSKLGGGPFKKPPARRARELRHTMSNEQIRSKRQKQRTHFRKPRKIGKFECHVCKKTCSYQETLSRHMLIHSGEKPFLCTICGKAFVRKSTLDVHLRIHTGEKRYKCDKCFKTFRHASSYIPHMLAHDAIKPYVCQICHKSFTQTGHLNRHLKLHSDVKPHECTLCGKRFRDKYKLKVHTKTHAKDK